MTISPKTFALLQDFILDHEQHSVEITLLSEEYRRRVPPGYRNLPSVRVKLCCFNGDDWRGVWEFCALDRVNQCIRKLLKKWEQV